METDRDRFIRFQFRLPNGLSLRLHQIEFLFKLGVQYYVILFQFCFNYIQSFFRQFIVCIFIACFD